MVEVQAYSVNRHSLKVVQVFLMLPFLHLQFKLTLIRCFNQEVQELVIIHYFNLNHKEDHYLVARLNHQVNLYLVILLLKEGQCLVKIPSNKQHLILALALHLTKE